MFTQMTLEDFKISNKDLFFKKEEKLLSCKLFFFNGIDFSSSVLFSIITASSQEKFILAKMESHLKIKIFAYDVIRMEENEDGRFWYIRGKSGNVHMQYVNIMK